MIHVFNLHSIFIAVLILQDSKTMAKQHTVEGYLKDIECLL